MTDVDVLVVGGGPAGLLTASRLATSHRVALIERAILGRTTKYWVTTTKRLQEHGLGGCVLQRPNAMIVGTYLGGKVLVPGDLAVVDDPRFLGELIDRCKNRGVQLAERCSLLNLLWMKSKIVAETDVDTFRARILVDASGSGSVIAETFRLHRLDGFLSVHGAHLHGIHMKTNDVILAYANVLGNPPPFIEVIPTGADSAYCTVFVYARTLVPPHSLDRTFRHQCRHNPFFDLTSESRYGSGKAGAIAIGSRHRRQLPGIISVGEAGLMQPPLLGSAFNEVLEYNGRICSHISELLRGPSDILPKAPNYTFPFAKRVQDRLQLSLARSLMRGNVETFDSLIKRLCVLPPTTVYDFCSNELTWSQLFGSLSKLAATFASVRRTSSSW